MPCPTTRRIRRRATAPKCRYLERVVVRCGCCLSDAVPARSRSEHQVPSGSLVRHRPRVVDEERPPAIGLAARHLGGNPYHPLTTGHALPRAAQQRESAHFGCEPGGGGDADVGTLREECGVRLANCVPSVDSDGSGWLRGRPPVPQRAVNRANPAWHKCLVENEG